MRLVNCITVAATCLGSTLAAQSPTATLARAAATYDSAKTMRVRFDQTVTNPLMGSTLVSHGELLRKKPNFLAIAFSDPAHDRIVGDGETLWVYLPSSAPGQVIKLSASTSPGMLIDPLRQVLTAPTDQYTITDAGKASIRKHATHAITLTPKQTKAPLFTKATVWIDDADATIRQIETTETSGITRQIVITKFIRDPSLSRSAFVFTPPAGVRVVETGP